MRGCKKLFARDGKIYVIPCWQSRDINITLLHILKISIRPILVKTVNGRTGLICHAKDAMKNVETIDNRLVEPTPSNSDVAVMGLQGKENFPRRYCRVAKGPCVHEIYVLSPDGKGRMMLSSREPVTGRSAPPTFISQCSLPCTSRAIQKMGQREPDKKIILLQRYVTLQQLQTPPKYLDTK